MFYKYVAQTYRNDVHITTSLTQSNQRKKLGTAELLFTSAQELGLQPKWLDYRKIFSIQTSSGEKYIDHSCSMLNSVASAMQVQDKYLTRVILDRHNLPNIPYALPRNTKEAEAFLAKHGEIIVKPKNGWGSHNIRRISRNSELTDITYPKYIFEKYIPGREMRYLVLNNEVIAVHHSDYGESVAVDRELQRISYEPQQWNDEKCAMALQIASIFDLHLTAVDFMVLADGSYTILEVNSSPGFKWFHAPSSGPAVNVALAFLQAVTAEK